MTKRQFGQLGVPLHERRAAINPYTGQMEPVGGQAAVMAQGDIDANLRTFMISVYNYMVLGLVVTGLVALATYMATVTFDPMTAARWDDGAPMMITETEYLNDLGALLWMTPVSYLVCFGPLLLLIFAAPVFRGQSPMVSFAVFMLVAVLIGVSFSGLALTYTNGSIAQMFFVTATAFGSLSLYGYTTKRDLSGWGSFLWMGFFGLLAAVFANWALGSDTLSFVISVVGVIVFSGFAMYDTQMIRDAYSDKMKAKDVDSLAISGALDLYLDFVNLFRFLLSLLGKFEE